MTDQLTPTAPPLSQDEQRRQLEQTIQGAMLGPLPKYYVNSVGFAQSAVDVSLVLMMNGQPVGVATMAYVTAKSIVADLSQILEKFEQASGQKLKTIGELNLDLSKAVQSPASDIRD
jgi:hypothetical protein